MCYTLQSVFVPTPQGQYEYQGNDPNIPDCLRPLQWQARQLADNPFARVQDLNNVVFIFYPRWIEDGVLCRKVNYNGEELVMRLDGVMQHNLPPVVTNLDGFMQHHPAPVATDRQDVRMYDVPFRKEKPHGPFSNLTKKAGVKTNKKHQHPSIYSNPSGDIQMRDPSTRPRRSRWNNAGVRFT